MIGYKSLLEVPIDICLMGLVLYVYPTMPNNMHNFVFCILHIWDSHSTPLTMQMIGSAWQSDESNENNNIVTSPFSLPGELFIESIF